MRTALTISLLCLLFSACKQTEQQADTSRAGELYRDLCATYRAYTDSMAHATDTTGTAERLEQGLDDALLRVYKRFPPDYDQYLSPSQNDTLWQLTERYMKQRALRLGGKRQHADTIPADTMRLHE
ncbi:MAG: hypothetical protein HDS66_02735 [Bacteroidales bacterium]|nr:hypothetical protein [Bacteroidales bacterium]